MSNRASEPWSDRIRNFLTIFRSELSSRLNRNHRQLLFGIRRRILAFIVILIALGYGIGYLKTETLVDYVVSREKVDLQDESQNKKLAIELALQTAYSQIISHEMLIPKSVEKDGPEKINEDTSSLQAEAIDLPLKPLDPNRGISDGALLATIEASELLAHSPHLEQHFEISSLRELAKLDGKNPNRSVKTMWSRIYWESRNMQPGDSQDEERVWIQLLRRENDNSQVASPGSKGTRFQLFRMDLTPVMQDLIGGTRQLSYFVGTDQQSKQLCVSPTGNPNPLQPSEEGLSNSVSLPKSLEIAIQKFELVHPPNKGIPRGGYLWSGEEGDEGVSVDQLLIADHTQRSNSLIYSETYAMPTEILEKLNTDVGKVRLKQIEELMRKQDSYVRIDQVDMTVGQIRIRALGPEYLALTQTFVLAYVRELEPDAKLRWKPIVMDNFVLSVQRVELPVDSQNASHNRFLGYLVRSASLEEIRGSVRRDINWLENVTYVAIAFAIVAALSVSWRLINPLTQMTKVAEKVSKLGRVHSDRVGEELEQLLSELPTTHGTEIGLLSKQFELTTRELMRAKRAAELAAESVKTEQRKVEQSGREKAIATEVNEHLVQLLGSVSHDMRQPLVQISTNAERLLNQPDLSPAHQERVNKVLRNTRELDRLIQDILDYNRIIKGDIHLEISNFELAPMLDEIESHYQEIAERRSVKLVVTTWWTGKLTTDRLRLKRVLNNLISNAINATQKGTVEILVTAVETDQIEIAVKDNGCGMSDLERQLVFTFAEERARILRQHRSLRTPKDANSTGLGLHIAKQLIERMGGTIRFSSVVDEGSTFIVRIPVAMARETADREPTESSGVVLSVPSEPRTNGQSATDSRSVTRTSNASQPAKANANNEHQHPDTFDADVTRPPVRSSTLQAVIVDDDPRCTTILAEMLQDIGYQSLRVHDGRSALEVITDLQPDLVTLDVIMPEIDGWEILQQLKSSRLTEYIPVVMVTVHPDESKATLLGASGFVSKPVEEASLHHTIAQAIGNRSGAKVLIVDDDPACLSELTDLLRPLGCRVISAMDGMEALERLADDPLLDGKSPFDLAIIDLYMPRMDGFALIEKLGEMPSTRDMPIVVLSAGVLSSSERENLLPHVTKFFGKGSVDLSTLRDEIARLLRRTTTSPAFTSNGSHQKTLD